MPTIPTETFSLAAITQFSVTGGGGGLFFFPKLPTVFTKFKDVVYTVAQVLYGKRVKSKQKSEPKRPLGEEREKRKKKRRKVKPFSQTLRPVPPNSLGYRT